jgi:L-threonylcarbamoyladenylate synthase
MTLKHYAPRAQVELFESTEELQARADKLRHEGKRIGVLDTATTIERLAQTVFAQLRDLDAQGVEMILCLLPAPQGLGLAVRDRLLRAAGKGTPT